MVSIESPRQDAAVFLYFGIISQQIFELIYSRMDSKIKRLAEELNASPEIDTTIMCATQEPLGRALFIYQIMIKSFT